MLSRNANGHLVKNANHRLVPCGIPDHYMTVYLGSVQRITYHEDWQPCGNWVHEISHAEASAGGTFEWTYAPWFFSSHEKYLNYWKGQPFPYHFIDKLGRHRRMYIGCGGYNSNLNIMYVWRRENRLYLWAQWHVMLTPFYTWPFYWGDPQDPHPSDEVNGEWFTPCCWPCNDQEHWPINHSSALLWNCYPYCSPIVHVGNYEAYHANGDVPTEDVNIGPNMGTVTAIIDIRGLPTLTDEQLANLSMANVLDYMRQYTHDSHTYFNVPSITAEGRHANYGGMLLGRQTCRHTVDWIGGGPLEPDPLMDWGISHIEPDGWGYYDYKEGGAPSYHENTCCTDWAFDPPIHYNYPENRAPLSTIWLNEVPLGGTDGRDPPSPPAQPPPT